MNTNYCMTPNTRVMRLDTKGYLDSITVVALKTEDRVAAYTEPNQEKSYVKIIGIA